MKIETKYNIGQEVFVMYEDRIHKRKVLDILIKCNSPYSIEIEYNIFGYIRKYPEKEVFLTEDDLLQYLKNNKKV